MNSILVIFVLYHVTFVPEYAASFPAEEACILKSKDYAVFPNYGRIAKCYPPNDSVKLTSEITYLTPEQFGLLGVKEFLIMERRTK